MKTIWKNKIVDAEIHLDLENSLDGTATILSNKNVLGIWIAIERSFFMPFCGFYIEQF